MANIYSVSYNKAEDKGSLDTYTGVGADLSLKAVIPPPGDLVLNPAVTFHQTGS